MTYEPCDCWWRHGTIWENGGRVVDHDRDCHNRVRDLSILWANLRTVVMLAAAARIGRCRCGRVPPAHRAVRWATPSCYVCIPADVADALAAERFEREHVL